MQPQEHKRKVFPVAALIALAIGCLCGICAGVAFAMFVIRSSASATPLAASTLSPTASVTRASPPVTRTNTPALAPTSTSSATAIAPTFTISPTGILTVTLPAGFAITTTTSLTTSFGLTATLAPLTYYTPTPATGAGRQDAWCLPWNTSTTQAQVIRVIDAITIEVSIQGEVLPLRYIGIGMWDVEPGGPEWQRAVDKNRELVEGKEILLIRDWSNTDEQGRLLRYVIVDGIFVNRELVASGYAVAESTPPDMRCDDLFVEAETLAEASQRGLWAPEPTPIPTRFIPTATPTPPSTGEIIITYIFYQGIPWQEWNEFVEIKNISSYPIQLKGWTLSNSEGHTFVFPSFLMQPGWYCRIYTNEYHPEACGLSFYRLSPVWDNLEDCAYLRDAAGNLIDTFCYE